MQVLKRSPTTQLSPVLTAFLVLTLLYSFLNGFNNSGALVAAPISSRALSPRVAIPIAIVGEFLGPFTFGSAVAATIGRDFVETRAISVDVLLAAVISVILWSLLTWFAGVPSSSSHALVGGLSGAALIAAGPDVIKAAGLSKILAGLLLGPILGLAGGYLLLKLILFLVQGATPRIAPFFSYSQAATTLLLSMSHGTNDGQKGMGLMILGLVVLGIQTGFAVPQWVTLAIAIAMALGVSAGGYRIIRTLGAGIYRLRPLHGFTSQAASGGIVLASALLGLPVATTQVTGTSIMGVGAAERVRGVRWEMAGQIVMAWLVTIPAAGALSAILYLALHALGL